MSDIFLKRTALAQITLLQTIQHHNQWRLPIMKQVAETRQQTGRIDDVNLKAIAQLTSTNYSSVYNTYNRLLANLAAIEGHQPAAHLLALPAGQLRAHLVQQSLAYQFLQHLVAADLSSFDDFLEAVNVSRATGLRYLRPLRDLGRKMAVRIVYAKMQLAGTETHIRLFLTLSFWLATDGALWPFTHTGHAEAAADVTRLLRALNLQLTNPVSRELLAYYLAISDKRLAQRHVVQGPGVGISGPVPRLTPVTVALPAASQRNEGESRLLAFMVLPLAVSPGDPVAKASDGLFTTYSPQIQQLVSTFLAVASTFQNSANRLLLQTSLAAIAMSVLNLGFDLGDLVAQYNPHLTASDTSAADRAAIQVALAQASAAVAPSADAALTQRLAKMMPVLATRFCDSLYLLRHFARPLRRVKVALLLGPAALGFVDLLTFIDQQPAVQLIYDHYAEADLIIQDSSLPLTFPDAERQPLIFHWRIDATSDLFGELFSLLRALEREL